MTIEQTHEVLPQALRDRGPRRGRGLGGALPLQPGLRQRSRRPTSKFWFCDSQHWPTVFKPFETIGGEFAVKCLGQYNTRHLLIPPANGIEFRSTSATST